MKVREPRTIALTGVSAALIFVATYFVRINVPVTSGIMHIGDGIIFMTAALLAPIPAGIAAALGSALANWMGAGGPQWIPVTLIAKFLLGYFASVAIRKVNNHGIVAAIFIIIEFLFIVVLYSTYSALIVNTPSVAWAAMPPMLLQATLGVAIGIAGVPMMKKLKHLIE